MRVPQISMHRHADLFKDIYFKDWSTQVWKLRIPMTQCLHGRSSGRWLQSASTDLKPRKQEAGACPGVSPESES